MPLIDAASPPTTDESHYIVYLASGEPSWCRDCRQALPALSSVFGPDSAPSAYVVRVGERHEWTGHQQNKYRKSPFDVQCVPTVVKLDKGRETGRLGDVDSQNETQLRRLIADS